MAEAVDANATLSFWQKLDPSHARWLFLAVFVIVICNVLFGAVRLYLELLIKRHHIEKLRAMPPSRRRDVEMGKNEEEEDSGGEGGQRRERRGRWKRGEVRTERAVRTGWVLLKGGYRLGGGGRRGRGG